MKTLSRRHVLKNGVAATEKSKVYFTRNLSAEGAKVKHVEDAARAAKIDLAPQETLRLEELGEKAKVTTLREGEKEMA